MDLHTYIKGKGLTLAEFAALINRSTATVSRIARGKVMPSPDTVREIMKATRNRVKANDFIEAVEKREAAE